MNRFQFLAGLLGIALTGYSATLPTITAYSRQYILLKRIASAHKCAFSQQGKSLILRKSGVNIQMTLERREAFLNRVAISLAYAPIKQNGNYYLSKVDYDNLLCILALQRFNVKKPVRILLDPGHGGKDPGCLSPDKKTKESQVVLQVAKHLAEDLKIWGFTVGMTRTTDQYLTLTQRTEIAKKWKADLFISLHINTVGNTNKKVCGLETHILPPSNAPATKDTKPYGKKLIGHAFVKQSALLGYAIQQGMLQATKAEDRSLRYSNFSVLRSAPCPAVLLELGFMSHPTELKNMLNTTYQHLLIAGIVGGVRTYQKSSK